MTTASAHYISIPDHDLKTILKDLETNFRPWGSHLRPHPPGGVISCICRGIWEHIFTGETILFNGTCLVEVFRVRRIRTLSKLTDTTYLNASRPLTRDDMLDLSLNGGIEFELRLIASGV